VIILHYLVGLTPVRGGGLVKYATDLMLGEQEQGENVLMLLPGPIYLKEEKSRNVSIQKSGNLQGIPIFYINNPLPIPMANGILDVEWYTSSCQGDIFEKFLQKTNPDIIHIHTFMGLYKEFLLASNKLNIPVFYSTHDYFGICPKTDLMFGDSVCSKPGLHCQECSRFALSKKRLILEQSRIYRIYRKSDYLISLLESKKLKNKLQELRSDYKQDKVGQIDTINYKNLFKYYQEMYQLVTYFHFNSSNTRKVYEKYFGKLPGSIINISNRSICDNRKTRYVKKVVRLGYLGGDYQHKGFDRILKILSELTQNKQIEVELHIYGSYKKIQHKFCYYHERYSHDELNRVFDSMDVLVVPSRCMETFGMVVLEAISYGIPVLLTDKVGAKDVIQHCGEEIGIVVKDNGEDLLDSIFTICKDPEILNRINRNIVNADIKLNYKDHVKTICEAYNYVVCMNDFI